MSRRFSLLVLLAFVSVVRAEDDLNLARALSAERDHAGAAIEYRRLALEAGTPERRAGFLWGAAAEYARSGDAARSDRMLDAAEDVWPAARDAASALRGGNAAARREFREAAFFYESAARSANAEERGVFARLAASAHLRAGNIGAARSAAELAGADAVSVVDSYADGPRRSPTLGGWLGAVPGLGYAYAGEPANAARSLILNALFIWGMVETAADEHWGGFAAITFFEITWYTGSIYGGIDASHRFNRRRLDAASDALVGERRIEADTDVVPAIRLRIVF